MSLIVGGHPASAAFDPSIFYSAISRSFLRDQCSTPCTSGTHQSMVTFRTPYTAFTILADFFVLDDLGGFDTILGLQIWQSCVRLHCTEFPSALPRIQSALNVPLPPFPPSGSFGPVLSPGVVSDNDTASDMTRAALPDTLLLAAPQLGSSAVVGSPSAYPYPIVCESTPSCSTLTQVFAALPLYKT
ncbi:hypothetical protein F5879DRAFT_949866 [Lentinula edodes]|nr:hypothetical protein F5879DRAFT_949866 [Lentinula edodes]